MNGLGQPCGCSPRGGQRAGGAARRQRLGPSRPSATTARPPSGGRGPCPAPVSRDRVRRARRIARKAAEAAARRRRLLLGLLLVADLGCGVAAGLRLPLGRSHPADGDAGVPRARAGTGAAGSRALGRSSSSSKRSPPRRRRPSRRRAEARGEVDGRRRRRTTPPGADDRASPWSAVWTTPRLSGRTPGRRGADHGRRLAVGPAAGDAADVRHQAPRHPLRAHHRPGAPGI